ncbi:hypothetical protein SAMN05216552_106020 [Pseudoduganella namucuonensis]|uniref:Uncharacterized protein n=2 Tax=Pseudoduganella namucuonensis TaxID=1035707 RepID=A0A1I7M5F1_9BURK|nr:hypothetical protein SAMN05216552_106020 [Pseudoduganella namucuonensis]
MVYRIGLVIACLLSASPSFAASTSDTESQATPPREQPGFWSKSYEPEQSFSNIEVAFARFSALEKSVLAHENIIKPPTDGSYEKELGAYARAGINLSDIACDAWLGQLGRTERVTSLQKDIMNIVGNALIGFAGINGASPSSLAKGALGLSAANASTDAFVNTVVMGTISDIQTKLKEVRKISAATLRVNVADNFDDTKSMLIEYHSSCSPTGIKQLLKDSLKAAKFVPPDTKLTEQTISARIASLKSRLTDSLYGGKQSFVTSDDDLYALYILSNTPSEDTSPYIATLRTTNAVNLLKKLSNTGDAGPAWLAEIATGLHFKERAVRESAAYKVAADVAEASAKAAAAAKASVTIQEAAAVQPAVLAKLDRSTSGDVKQAGALANNGEITQEKTKKLEEIADRSAEKLGHSKDPTLKKLSASLNEFSEKQKAAEIAKDNAVTAAVAPVLPDSAKITMPLSNPVSINAVIDKNQRP